VPGDGLVEGAGAAVVEERRVARQPVAEAEQRRGAPLTAGRRALAAARRQAGAEIVEQQVGVNDATSADQRGVAGGAAEGGIDRRAARRGRRRGRLGPIEIVEEGGDPRHDRRVDLIGAGAVGGADRRGAAFALALGAVAVGVGPQRGRQPHVGGEGGRHLGGEIDGGRLEAPTAEAGAAVGVDHLGHSTGDAVAVAVVGIGEGTDRRLRHRLDRAGPVEGGGEAERDRGVGGERPLRQIGDDRT
jgi:hypothetical protein